MQQKNPKKFDKFEKKSSGFSCNGWNLEHFLIVGAGKVDSKIYIIRFLKIGNTCKKNGNLFYYFYHRIRYSLLKKISDSKTDQIKYDTYIIYLIRVLKYITGFSLTGQVGQSDYSGNFLFRTI